MGTGREEFRCALELPSLVGEHSAGIQGVLVISPKPHPCLTSAQCLDFAVAQKQNQCCSCRRELRSAPNSSGCVRHLFGIPKVSLKYHRKTDA